MNCPLCDKTVGMTCSGFRHRMVAEHLKTAHGFGTCPCGSPDTLIAHVAQLMAENEFEKHMRFNALGNPAPKVPWACDPPKTFLGAAAQVCADALMRKRSSREVIP